MPRAYPAAFRRRAILLEFKLLAFEDVSGTFGLSTGQ
jgi:hypothetical protein